MSRQSVSKWEVNSVYPDTEKLIAISKLFHCSLDYLLKEEIEQVNINVSDIKEIESYDRLRGWILTCLCFVPFMGYSVVYFSIRFQVRYMRNKLQTILSVIGFLFSVAVTAVLIVIFLYTH